jgi:nucleotide-binding universal stress UspA family protein
MHWLVGIDPWNLSAGAVAWARFMAKRAPRERFVGAHVIAFDLSELFARVDPKAKAGDIPPYVERLLDPLRDDPTFTEVGMVVSSSAEDGLQAAARERDCGGFIIGRRNPAQGKAVVRLGGVARRLLRALPNPVFVVPPDETQFSDGPVLVATSLTSDSDGATRFGAAMARMLGLDLLVTTVAVSPALSLYMPGEDWTPVVEQNVRKAHHELDQWATQYDLGEARRSVVEGAVGPRLREVAQTAGASMIVVGSRRLSAIDRIFASSIGTELAASATMPVAVVPPEWTG